MVYLFTVIYCNLHIIIIIAGRISLFKSTFILFCFICCGCLLWLLSGRFSVNQNVFSHFVILVVMKLSFALLVC